MSGMSVRDKLAQLIVVRLGSDVPPKRSAEEDEERVARLLEVCPIGGLALFNGAYAETPATLERLQRLSGVPLLVGADMERGAGQQLRPFPLMPHAMAFDALGPDAAEAVFEFARLAGLTARAAGVQVTFGPVADVNSDPRNPIVSTRAFSAEPRRVAELAAAYVRGCREAGILATAKHFPGHGDTHEDSHDGVPTVEVEREVLDRRELAPFRGAIAAGVPLIMTAHVRFPALDPSGMPATFSQPIATRLLREELGFGGAVITDSLLMEGAKIGFVNEGELAIAALSAGADILLDVAEPLSTLDALESAAQVERIAPERIEESFQRMQRLKSAAFDQRAASGALDSQECRHRTQQLALDVARRATVVLKDDRGLLPLRRDCSLYAVLIDPFERPRNMPLPPLGEFLREQFSTVEYSAIGAEPTAEELASIHSSAMKAAQTLVAFVVKPAAWYRFGLPPALQAWLQRLAAARPVVAACLGSPRGLESLGGAAVHICTYSDVPASQQALVERLRA